MTIAIRSLYDDTSTSILRYSPMTAPAAAEIKSGNFVVAEHPLSPMVLAPKSNISTSSRYAWSVRHHGTDSPPMTMILAVAAAAVVAVVDPVGSATSELPSSIRFLVYWVT